MEEKRNFKLLFSTPAPIIVGIHGCSHFCCTAFHESVFLMSGLAVVPTVGPSTHGLSYSWVDLRDSSLFWILQAQ